MIYFGVALGTYLVGFVVTVKFMIHIDKMNVYRPTGEDIACCLLWPIVAPIRLITEAALYFWKFAVMEWKIPKWNFKRAKKNPHRPMAICDVCKKEMPHKGPLA